MSNAFGWRLQKRQTILIKWQSKGNAAILLVLRLVRANPTSDASVFHPLQPFRANSTSDASVIHPRQPLLKANTDLVTDLTVESNALYISTCLRYGSLSSFSGSSSYAVYRLYISDSWNNMYNFNTIWYIHRSWMPTSQ